jgi:transcription elongation factor S-II
VVGRLRTHEDKNVADLAKDTVRKWKNDVGGSKKPEAASTASASAGKSAPATSPTKASVVPNGAVKVEKSANGAEDGKAKAPRTSVTDNIPKQPTGDKVRDTSIALFYNAIALDREECISPPPQMPRRMVSFSLFFRFGF